MPAPAPLSRRRLLTILPFAAISAAMPVPSSAQVPPRTAPPAVTAGVTIASDISDPTSCPTGFDPLDLTIAAGTTVTWTNECGAPLVLSAKAESAPKEYQAWQSDEMADGESWSYTFRTPGSFSYWVSEWLCGDASITIT